MAAGAKISPVTPIIPAFRMPKPSSRAIESGSGQRKLSNPVKRLFTITERTTSRGLSKTSVASVPSARPAGTLTAMARETARSRKLRLALPKNSLSVEPSRLILGARTPSSAPACVSTLTSFKGNLLATKFALRAQCGRGRPRSQQQSAYFTWLRLVGQEPTRDSR